MGSARQMCAMAVGAAVTLLGARAAAQETKTLDAQAIVQEAVRAELAANRSDTAHWRYVVERKDEQRSVSVVVETESGALTKRIEEGGRPVTPADAQADDEHIQKFLHDPALRQKQVRDGMHDEKDAEELLNLMPRAFTWTIERETPESVVLAFKPDPNFHPPDMEARVMGEMVGTMVVDRGQHRIRTMRGALGVDVTIGFGILGRLRKGGTFDVERREVAPGLWEITETHVHIDGRALFFKTIGEQQDEVKTKFSLVPAGTTLEQAVGMLSETPGGGASDKAKRK